MPSNSTQNRLAEELANRSLTTVVLESIMAALVMFFSFSGNLLVWVAVCRNPSLRTAYNYLVISLALTDVSLSILCSPLTLVYVITGRMALPDWLCQAQAYLIFSLGILSLVTMTQMAVHRYLKVVHPTRCASTRTVIRIIIATWVVLLLFPSIYFATNRAVFYPGELYCFMKVEEMPKDLVITSGIIFAVIPLTVMIFCYSKVFAKVHRHKQNTKGSLQAAKGSQCNRLSQEELRITIVSVTVVVGFAICWTPVFFLWTLSFYEVHVSRKVRCLSTFFAAMSSCLNPFIYGVLNREFKKEFKKMLTSCIGKSSAVSPESLEGQQDDKRNRTQEPKLETTSQTALDRRQNQLHP